MCTDLLSSIANVILQSGSTVPDWILKLPKPSKMKRREMGKVKRADAVNAARRIGRQDAIKKRCVPLRRWTLSPAPGWPVLSGNTPDSIAPDVPQGHDQSLEKTKGAGDAVVGRATRRGGALGSGGRCGVGSMSRRYCDLNVRRGDAVTFGQELSCEWRRTARLGLPCL